MKDRKGLVHGDNDCKIVCPNGPPVSCPIYACSRRFNKFREDISKPEPVKKAKKNKSGVNYAKRLL